MMRRAYSSYGLVGSLILLVALSGCNPGQSPVEPESGSSEPELSAEEVGDGESERAPAQFSVAPGSTDLAVSGDMRITGITTIPGRPTTSAVRRDSILAIGSGRSVLLHDLDTGTSLGSRELDGPVRDLGAGEFSFFAVSDGYVEAFTPGDGSRWRVELSAPPSTPLLATRSSLYLGLENGAVLSLGADQGRERFQSASGGDPVAAVTLAAGGLYVVDAAGRFSRLSATTGEPVWEVMLGAAPAGPLTADATSAVVVTADGTALLVDAQTGAVLIERDVNPVDTGWALLSDGQFVSSGAERVESVDVTTERVVWTVDGVRGLSVDPFRVGATLFLAHTDSFASVSPSGRAVSTLSLPAAPVAPPHLFGDTLLVPLGNGDIVSVAVDGSEAELPVLTSGRVWQLPPGGVFRLGDRQVSLSLRSAGGGVFDITVTSVPAQDLLLSVVGVNGQRVATNMGKVELDQTVRASLEPDVSYRLEIVRPSAAQEIELTVDTERVE